MGILDDDQELSTADYAAQQDEAEKQKQRDLAQERVERRERLGQQAQPEPALDGSDEETSES